jgi:chemotaxis methyl-accepting protein methylase
MSCCAICKGWDIQIIATDISQGDAAGCRARHLRVPRHCAKRQTSLDDAKYFETVDGGFSAWWIPCASSYSGEQMNLLEPFSGIGQFDVVFLRNVLIYFEAEPRAEIWLAGWAIRCCRTVGSWSVLPRTCSTPARSSCRRRTVALRSTNPS